jgi:hypothetical protein
MTIHIKVTNEDSRESAIIEVTPFESGVPQKPQTLKGGESTSNFYLTNSRTIEIKEIQNG